MEYNDILNEFSTEICYPDELADPFYEEDDTGTSAESEEEIKQFFFGNCVSEV